MQPKKSFFERLTGTSRTDDESVDVEETRGGREGRDSRDSRGALLDNEESDGELTVDVYQTPDEIVIKTMVAGVRPEDLDINITRDVVAIKGSRAEDSDSQDQDYFHKELYWGTFSRTINLPEEIEVEDAEAIEKHGLLTIRLPKIDKTRQNKLKVKSI